MAVLLLPHLTNKLLVQKRVIYPGTQTLGAPLIKLTPNIKKLIEVMS